MTDMDVVAAALLFFVVSVGLGALMYGIRRIRWRFAALFGVGFGIVIGAGYVATSGRLVDPALLVIVGAFGGAVAQLAFERGEGERRRISEGITSIREVHFT